MTKEDKELLLKDLCARLPYGVKCNVWLGSKCPALNKKDEYIDDILETVNPNGICTFNNAVGYDFGQFPVENVMPYLRPMSSMTEEEVDYDLEDTTTLKGLNAEVEYNPDTCRIQTAEYVIGTDIRFGEHTDEYPPIDHHDMYKTIDWLNEHHFDYRGLIEKGLALEAPEGMYNLN